MLKCDLFVVANLLVTDKTHSGQVHIRIFTPSKIFPAAPAQLLRINFGAELQFGPILTAGTQKQNIFQFVYGPLQALQPPTAVGALSMALRP